MPMPPDIHINLLEHDTSRQQARAEVIIIVLLTAVIALVMLAVHFNQVQKVEREKKINRQLQQEMLKYRPAQAAMLLNQNIEQELAAKNKTIATLKSLGIPATSILADIDSSMPDKVTAINIIISDAKITLKGYAPDFYSVAALVVSLQSRERFHEVKVLNAQLEEDSGEVVYTIEMAWRGSKT